MFVTYSRHTGLAGGVASEDPDARQLVIGSNGNDTLIGGPQGDYLFAGTGKQTLTGLAGADRFVFDLGATRATITDFEAGIDKLVFKHAGNLDWHDVHDQVFARQHHRRGRRRLDRTDRRPTSPTVEERFSVRRLKTGCA